MTHTAATSFRWHIFARHVASLGAVLLVIGVIALIVLGLRPLAASATKALTDSPVTIQFLWPKVLASDPTKPAMTWIPRDWQARLLDSARATVGLRPDPMDPAVLTSLRESLNASGWFETTPIVRREGSSGIVIDGQWRTPAAVVKFASAPGASPQLLWLSTNAMPMPKVAEAGQARPRVLENPASGPPTNADGVVNFNAPWPGDDIAAGLELLALVARQPWANQVAGVDASEFTTKQSLTLTTIYATRVVWGGTPTKPRYGDASTKEKLRHIATLFGDTKRIDGGHPIVFVDSSFLMFDRSATAEIRRQQTTPTPRSPDLPTSPSPSPKPGARAVVPSPGQIHQPPKPLPRRGGINSPT